MPVLSPRSASSPESQRWKNPFYFTQPVFPLISNIKKDNQEAEYVPPGTPLYQGELMFSEKPLYSEKLLYPQKITFPQFETISDQITPLPIDPKMFQKISQELSPRITPRITPEITQELLPEVAEEPTVNLEIPQYPASYSGKVNPASIFGCRLLARKLNDLYQVSSARCSRRKFVNFDYFGIIAREQEKGNCLVGIGPNWILPSFIEYYEYGRRDILRLPRLRRKDAEYQKVFGERRNFHSNVLPSEIDLNNLAGNLSIYTFTDQDFKDSEVWLLFAPVSPEEAQRIIAWTKLNEDYYMRQSYLTVMNLPKTAIYDFEYLFPVVSRTFGNLTIFESETCSGAELRNIFHRFEIEHAYPRLNWKIATYAAFLLGEATFYQFPIRWENSKIIIGECGYIQAYDLFGKFERICADIVASGVKFLEVDSWQQAATLCNNTDFKAFYGQGKYWVAVPADYNFNYNLSNQTFNQESLENLDLIELDFPLRAIRKLPESAKLYFEHLGYTVESPETNEYVIEIGTRTIVQGEVVLTEYYYLSSAGKEIRVYVGQGKASPQLKDLLEKYLATGHSFPPRIKNLMDSYPGFVPSFQPIPLNLSVQPGIAQSQLINLLQK